MVIRRVLATLILVTGGVIAWDVDGAQGTAAYSAGVIACLVLSMATGRIRW